MLLANQVLKSVALQPKGIVKRGLVAEYRFDNWRNLLKWSEDFSNAAWTKSYATITGTNTVRETADNQLHSLSESISVLANFSYTFSVKAKADGRNRIMLREATSTGSFAVFDLGAGTVISTSGAAIANIEGAGDGYYLCSVTIPTTTASSKAYRLYTMLDNGSVFADATFVGDVTKGVIVAYAHLQLASQANQSYQKTTDGQTLTDYKGGYNGQLGSTAAADANDPTPDGVGLSFVTDDYIGGALSNNIETIQMVFYNGTVISPATLTQRLISTGTGDTRGGIGLGASTADLTDEIVALVQGAAGGRSGWCDANGTIQPGYHIVEVRWNGAYWDIFVDGDKKPITTANTPTPITATEILFGKISGAANYFTGVMFYTLVYSNGLLDKELCQNRRQLKKDLAEKGVAVSWAV